MKKYVYFFLIICLISFNYSCKKKAIKIYPNIVGRWQKGIAYTDPCSSKSFYIDSDGKGFYSIDTDTQQEKYEGKAKIEENTLFIQDYEICKVFEVIDTVGYFYHGSYCYYPGPDQDSIKFTGIFKSEKKIYSQGGIQTEDDLWYRFEFSE